jgi:hypothetical protein
MFPVAKNLPTGGCTAISTLAVARPPELMAVTVKAEDEVTAVGVPEMTPLIGSRLSPAGSAGDIRKDTTRPPLYVGVLGTIASPAMYIAALVE